MTAAARKPGASPQPIPEIPAALSRLPVIKAAVRKAKDAMADATRRAADRATRTEAAARAQEMRLQAATGTDGWTWWRAHLADLDVIWDALECEASDRDRPRVRAQREATFCARWRQWQAARRAVVRPGAPPPRDRRHGRADLENIPW